MSAPFGDFIASIEVTSGKLIAAPSTKLLRPGNERAVNDGGAENIANFLLHASAVLVGPVTQAITDFIIEIADNKLCHSDLHATLS